MTAHPKDALKMLALRGGVFIALRQVGGMLISLGGLLVVTRLLGPENYGLFVTAFGLTNAAFLVGQWGVNVYLVRSVDIDGADWSTAVTLMLAIGTVAGLAGVLSSTLAERLLNIPGLGRLLATMSPSLPLQLVILVPLARLEREMRYRRVAACELVSQASLYAGSIGGALAGLGAEAPVLGVWTQHLALGIAVASACRGVPKPGFDRKRARLMLGYGFTYSVSHWVWYLRLLVTPLVVAPVLGTQAAAVVGVASRLVTALGFVRIVTWRIYLPLLARLRDEPAELARALGQGIRLQVLAVGAALAAFGVVGPAVVGLAFGPDWTDVLAIYPYVAVGFLFNAMFNLQASALYVLGRNWTVTLYHSIHVLLFAGAVWLLVPHFGLQGYGLAEIIGIAAYGVAHERTQRVLGTVPVGLALAWACGFAVTLFAPLWGAWAGVGLLAVLSLPATWRQLEVYRDNLLRLREGGV